MQSAQSAATKLAVTEKNYHHNHFVFLSFNAMQATSYLLSFH